MADVDFLNIAFFLGFFFPEKKLGFFSDFFIFIPPTLQFFKSPSQGWVFLLGFPMAYCSKKDWNEEQSSLCLLF